MEMIRRGVKIFAQTLKEFTGDWPSRRSSGQKLYPSVVEYHQFMYVALLVPPFFPEQCVSRGGQNMAIWVTVIAILALSLVGH